MKTTNKSERLFSTQVNVLLLCLGSMIILAAPFKTWAQTDGSNSFVEGEPNVVAELPSPIESFFKDVLETINPIIDQTKEVIAEINGGSLEDAILSTLGSIGLLDPHEEANSVSASEQSPYSAPQSPEEVAIKAEAADAIQSQVSDRLSQIVFGQKGQEAIDEQNKVLGQTQEFSTLAQTATDEVYEVAKDIALDNYQYALEIEQQAAQAQAANASQDVLKALAAQNEYMAGINAGISQQLALLGEAQIYNSIQMNGLTEQLTISNQRQQNIETFLASQNSQLAEIDSNQELQIKQSIEKEAQQRARNRQGMTRIFIPGLFESAPAQNNSTESDANQDGEEQNNLDVIPASTNNNFFQDLSTILNQ